MSIAVKSTTLFGIFELLMLPSHVASFPVWKMANAASQSITIQLDFWIDFLGSR